MSKERYRILRKLGEGGCGRTYLVRDRKLGRLWAMKELKPEDGRERGWEEEFRILRELDSPCFPRLVECFREEGKQYLVMDWVRGLTLEKKLIQNGPLDWKEAADCALQLCGALEKLHGGIPAVLHLDLKPSNIILTQDGPRLIDFGSAVLAGECKKTAPEDNASVNEKSANNASAGREHVLTGTPGFAAPELYEGREADAGSDVYSLGAVLQVMLTGKKPQEKGERPKDVPERLWEITERALCEDRQKRFRNAGEMKKALEDLLENGKRSNETKERGRTRSLQTGLVLVLLTAALGACLYLPAVRQPAAARQPSAVLQPENAFVSIPESLRVQKKAFSSEKRLEAFSHGSIWELVRQGEEAGKMLGLRHDFGEAVRKAAERWERR